MKIIFAKGDCLRSRLVRLATRSKWSHCGIVFGSHVLEAKGQIGVRLTPMDEFTKRYSLTEIVETEGEPRLALDQVGSPYDSTGCYLPLLPFCRSNTFSPSKWYCASLVALALPGIKNKHIRRHTPASLYKLCQH